MKKLILLWILLSTGTLTACNTTEGVGEDVQAAGQGVEDAAENTSEEIDEEFDD